MGVFLCFRSLGKTERNNEGAKPDAVCAFAVGVDRNSRVGKVREKDR